MVKNYNQNVSMHLQPKTETINFLLNYSKSLGVIKTKDQVIKVNLN